MPSSPRRALPMPWILLSALPAAALSACASPPAVYLNASPCSQLVPETWRKGVESAPLPAHDTVGEWVAFGDAQTAQLDKANGRTADALGIVEKCEARDRAAGKARLPRWWKVF